MPTIEISEEMLEKIKEQLGTDLNIKQIENMESLIGQTFMFQCARYIYHGEVIAVNATFIELKNASVVFNTGDYSSSEPEDSQKLPNNAHVMRQSIEAFFKMKW